MRIVYLVMLLVLTGCLKAPTMTEQYIEVIKPGQTLGLSKLKVEKIDTTFGYPLEEQEMVTYTVVNRISGKQVNGNASFKIYFSRKHIKYKWRVRNDPFLADYYDVDTIQIEPYTWYRLSTWKYGFYLYFFWDESKGTYIHKFKPKPGAW
jgi:hypothetical protein